MFFKQGSYILLVTSTWQHGKQNGRNSLRFWGERKCQRQLRRRTRGVNSRAFFLRWNSTNVVWWINGFKEAIGLSMFFFQILIQVVGMKARSNFVTHGQNGGGNSNMFFAFTPSLGEMMTSIFFEMFLQLQAWLKFLLWQLIKLFGRFGILRTSSPWA